MRAIVFGRLAIITQRLFVIRSVHRHHHHHHHRRRRRHHHRRRRRRRHHRRRRRHRHHHHRRHHHHFNDCNLENTVSIPHMEVKGNP